MIHQGCENDDGRAVARDSTRAMCHISDMMAKEIQAIMDRIQTWPAEKQQLAYELLIWIEAKDQGETADLTAEDWTDLGEGLAEADSGELDTEDETQEAWPLTAEERAELEEAEREIERGEVASDEEMVRIFRLGRP